MEMFLFEDIDFELAENVFIKTMGKRSKIVFHLLSQSSKFSILKQKWNIPFFYLYYLIILSCHPWGMRLRLGNG